jgi:hypothetical protein
LTHTTDAAAVTVRCASFFRTSKLNRLAAKAFSIDMKIPHFYYPPTPPGAGREQIRLARLSVSPYRHRRLSQKDHMASNAFFVAPHGGTLSPECRESPDKLEGDVMKHCGEEGTSYNRPADQVFVEWDRKLIYGGTTTGLCILSSPALGKPVLGAMPVTEWSLPQLNAGATS